VEKPWGLGRMSGALPVGPPGYARVELDPDTQCARYYDQAGQPVEMGVHGTSKQHGTTTVSRKGTDGQKDDAEVSDDNNVDYSPD
jgi:putative ATP-grasp target RiPP